MKCIVCNYEDNDAIENILKKPDSFLRIDISRTFDPQNSPFLYACPKCGNVFINSQE